MKRLTLLYDGTWNDQATRTNVFDLGRALNKQWSNQTSLWKVSPSVSGVADQWVWYDPGVGTHWYDHLRGGGFGLGISQNIRQGYQFLSDHWREGDEICVLGFSRGAYTARSLVGVIRRWGLLARAAQDEVGLIYNLYRAPQEVQLRSAERTRWDQVVRSAVERYFRLVPVKLIGVWDTVGALGVPTSKGITRLFTNAPFSRDKYAFHDTRLSGIVENAFHALAVDEFRPDFMPTLWTAPAPGAPPAHEAVPFAPEQEERMAEWRSRQRICQRWFPGAHADIGGGYPDYEIGPDGQPTVIKTRPLRDLPPGPLGYNLKYESLAWMQQCAKTVGLRFDFEFKPRPDNAIKAPMHNPMAKWNWKLINFLEGNRPSVRPCPAHFSREPDNPQAMTGEAVIGESLDDSIELRRRTEGKPLAGSGLDAEGEPYDPAQFRGRVAPASQ